MTVQDEDAEDEDALAGGEDDVESQHDPVGPSASVGLSGRQLPDGEAEVGYDGADQEQQQDGVTEDLGELGPSLTISSSATVTQLTGRLQLRGSQLMQGLIPPSVMRELYF